MKKFHGFSGGTAKKIVLDVGAFFAGYDVTKSYEENVAAGKRIGATQGGGGFTATPDRRVIRADGLPENLIGMDETEFWTPTMNVKMLEQDAANLKRALGMADVENVQLKNVNYKKITPRDHTEESDYLNNITYAGRIRGSSFPVLIVLEKALNIGGLGWTFADRAETISDVTFTGHYYLMAEDTLSEAPFAIYIPDDVDDAAAARAMA